LAAKLPDNPVAQLVLADQSAKDGQWAEAEARFAALPQQGLTQVLRPLLVAWAEQGAGRTSAAIATLQPLTESGQLRGVMALHAAMIADLGGQAADAARFYQLAQNQYGGLNLRLGVVLASWQARSGFVTEGQQTIRTIAGGSGELSLARPALEADVTNRAVPTALDGIAETYLALGATLRQQNALDSAQVMLRLALSMRPNFASAQLLLAEIQADNHRPRLALATLDAVPADDPLAAVVQLRVAGLQDTIGNEAAAVRGLERLARAFPDRPEPLAAEAEILSREGRYADATDVLNRAIARVGTPSRANWPLFFERGTAYERAGDWPRAEADLQYALQLSPDQPTILNYLGYAWTERGEHLPEARDMLERAVQLRPNEGSYIDSLGWVQLRSGDDTAALKTLQRAVELQPEDAVINGHLGDAMAAVGHWRDAEFQWRRALTLNPDPADAERINAKLAAMPQGVAASPHAAGAASR
jgi:tetratricopeptide (TPR) repeat protein